MRPQRGFMRHRSRCVVICIHVSEGFWKEASPSQLWETGVDLAACFPFNVHFHKLVL